MAYIIPNIKSQSSGILASGIIRVPAPVFPAAFRASASCVSYFFVRKKECDIKIISAGLESCLYLAKAMTVHPVVTAGNVSDIHFPLAIDGFPAFSVFGSEL